MKSKSLIALAVAGTLSCAGAFAGSTHRAEVQTPTSISESAPWLAAQPQSMHSSPTEAHMSLAMSHELASSDSAGMVSRFESTTSTSAGSTPVQTVEVKEYWLIGSESEEGPRNVGSTASVSGSGSVGFSSGTSESAFDSFWMQPQTEQSSFDSGELIVYTPDAEAIYQTFGDVTPLLSEHYLIAAPSSTYDPSSVLVLAIAPTAEDIALLQSLKADFFVVTPIYGDG